MLKNLALSLALTSSVVHAFGPKAPDPAPAKTPMVSTVPAAPMPVASAPVSVPTPMPSIVKVIPQPSLKPSLSNASQGNPAPMPSIGKVMPDPTQPATTTAVKVKKKSKTNMEKGLQSRAPAPLRSTFDKKIKKSNEEPGPLYLPAKVMAVGPRYACGDRNFISMAWCMNQKCAETEFSSHQQCIDLREQQKASSEQNHSER